LASVTLALSTPAFPRTVKRLHGGSGGDFPAYQLADNGLLGGIIGFGFDMWPVGEKSSTKMSIFPFSACFAKKPLFPLPDSFGGFFV